MILEIADIRIRPGRQQASDEAIVGSFVAAPSVVEHVTLLARAG